MTAFEEPGQVRFIDAAKTYPLRLDVLRPGRAPEAARFPGDDDPDTRHLGAFRAGDLLGIASLFRVELPERPGSAAYQLRGMATAPQAQKTGLGRLLLLACVEYARGNGAAILWCNARTSALGFYRKSGFEILGDQFDIPDVGPHFRMLFKL